MGAERMTEDDMARIVERMQRAARAAVDKVSPTVREQRVWEQGVRLLEEAIEAFQACGGDAEMGHKIVERVFAGGNTQTCLHDSGTRDEGEGEYCTACGQVVVR